MIVQIEPWIDNDELEQLKRVISSTFLNENELTREFEQKIAALTGSKHAIAVSNGSMALYCCVKALGIGAGDEIIVPDLTFIATATAVIMAGAKPVFCDVDRQIFQIDIAKAKNLVTQRTRGIIPVHLYGGVCDMDELQSFATTQNLWIIEDAAQGVGVHYKNKHVGTLGEIGMLSFYGNKTITCGQGGVVLTDRDDLAQACMRLKNYGRNKKGTFVHDEIGYNFAFTDLQAAIGISQLNKLNRIIDKKKQIFELYSENLTSLSQLKPQLFNVDAKPVHWFTSFLAEQSDALIAYLDKNGIQTRKFFHPLHLQPCFNDLQQAGTFEHTDYLSTCGVSLPSSYSLKIEEQWLVIDKIKDFYAGRD